MGARGDPNLTTGLLDFDAKAGSAAVSALAPIGPGLTASAFFQGFDSKRSNIDGAGNIWTSTAATATADRRHIDQSHGGWHHAENFRIASAAGGDDWQISGFTRFSPGMPMAIQAEPGLTGS